MTVTKEQVRAKLGASIASVPDDDVDLALSVAGALITAHVGEANVPIDVLDRAKLLVAVEQINQDKAPNGVVNQAYATGEGDVVSTPVRIGRDPMKPAYPILAPWVSGRFFCA